MRRVLLLLIGISLWRLSPNAGAAPEANGILLYEEPASSYVEALEYRSFSRDNVLYSTVVQLNGQRRQVKTSGVVGAFDYPPATFDSSFPEKAHAVLEKLQAVERRSPGVSAQLESARAKWERALEAYQQADHAGSAATPVTPSLSVLKVKSAQYFHARLVDATVDTATIAHDTGVAKIPIQQLDVSAIVSLNGTSKTAQVGTSVPPVEHRGTGAKGDGSLTGKLKAGGMRVLNIVQDRTGLPSDDVATWLLFAIFPLVIVLLMVSSSAQGRQSKKTASSRETE